MTRKFFPVFALLVVLAMVLVACGSPEPVRVEKEVVVTEEVQVEVVKEVAVTFAGGGDTLAIVQDRGILKCAINDHKIGFGFLLEDGSLVGFDWDYCRAVAAATLGDAEAVEGRPTSSSDRFPVLQSGEVDLLVRNTTWNLTRDTSLGFDFAPTTYYDGQGMMVPSDSGVTSLGDLDGATVCVSAGTTTEKNLADAFRALGLEYEPVIFNKSSAASEAYQEGRCDAYTSDKTSLVSRRSAYENPGDHVILPIIMSKEPLGPVVRHGDNNWFDIVKWTVNCTIAAEELGVNQTNVNDMLGSDDPSVLELLGIEGDLGQAMGLNNDFCYQVIKQVGNYEDIYNRNLGPDTQVDLPRDLNSLWTDGGLLYSPPFH